jgi:hypothetical protein
MYIELNLSLQIKIILLKVNVRISIKERRKEREIGWNRNKDERNIDEITNDELITSTVHQV